jgi:hypothetical protein
MGEKGNLTRLLAGKYGAHLTFAALSPERASAPGQPTIAQLRSLYGFATQGPATKLFGIMGRPVGHSKSPLIHNSAFRALGNEGAGAGAVLVMLWWWWYDGLVTHTCCPSLCTSSHVPPPKFHTPRL